MAAASVLEVWKKAATMMGETSSQVVVSATSPTKPIELTFDDLYDEIRVAMLKQVSPLFARAHELLHIAPTHKPNGDPGSWMAGWSKAYKEPDDSIKFEGFTRDRYDLGVVADFKRGLIPVKYEAITQGAGTGPIYQYALRSVGTWMRNVGYQYHHFHISDEYGIVQEGVAYNDDLTTSRFTWLARDTGDPLKDDMGGDFLPAAGNNMDIDVDNPGWNWPTTTYPTPLTINIATQPATLADWSNAIFTNRAEPIGVYITDVTDPAQWSDEFVTLVAVELARRGCVSHAKSSKLIRILTDERVVALSNAIALDASSDDNFEDNRMSSAEQARL